jgi:uncharacterized protein
MKAKNVFTWVDIPTKDFHRAVKFYSELLGEEVRVDDSMGMKLGFLPMEGKEGVGGGLVPPNPEHEPSPNGTRVYLSCEGILDDIIGRVEKIGGKIVQPKFKLEGAGWIALIEDSEGNIVGLHSFS